MSGKYIRILVISLFWLGLLGASAQVQSKPISEVNPKELDQAILLDVRTPGEYNSGHLENAVNIDWQSNDFRERVVMIPRDKTVYVYCQKGGRSAKAAGVLDSLGYKVIDLTGGYEQYRKE